MSDRHITIALNCYNSLAVVNCLSDRAYKRATRGEVSAGLYLQYIYIYIYAYFIMVDMSAVG
jgi:hypothetical protein